ncbi:MAG: Os1348 family NHLP clan protein [Chloroflexi bacterium]|nr:Os1348 family NHLP clan protein [Chloroflexota bacterium]
MAGVEQLVDRWLNEPGFKDQLIADPEGTVKASGLILDAGEWATLRNAVISLSDGELQARISKGGGWVN